MRRKDGPRVTSTIRMLPEEITQAEKAMQNMGLASRNEYFLSLHRKNIRQQEDLDGKLSKIVDRLDRQMGRRMQQINTSSQLTLALLTAFMKYTVSVMPTVPDELREAAIAQGRQQYEKIERYAMREFRAARLEKRFEEGSLEDVPCTETPDCDSSESMAELTEGEEV